MKITYNSDGLVLVPETQMEKDHMLLCIKEISYCKIDKEGNIKIRFTMAYEREKEE